MTPRKRNGLGFTGGALIGTLGGLIGLGGAEFRLPMLVGAFKLPTLQALILNKAMSLVVVAVALIARGFVIAPDQVWVHLDVMLNLLAGSLVGAWWGAGHAITLTRHRLDCIIMVLLVGLSALMLWEAGSGLPVSDAPLFLNSQVRWMAGVIAGFGIGVVAALLGVAGGELLIPTIVLLFGLDIRLAGSLSLMVSLPTIVVGLLRYARADAFSVLQQERLLMRWMVAGSILGAALGGLLLGWVPTRPLMGLLGLVLLISAVMTFKHTSTANRKNTCF